MKVRVWALITALAFVLAGRVEAAQPQVLQITFQSPALSDALRQPVQIYASVLLPDSYYKTLDRRYPTVYVIPAFNGSDWVGAETEREWQRPMRSLHAEFVVVFLQGMMSFDGEEIHTEFADSAYLGPWGTALTKEFIPATDAHFRTIASGNGRFLFGHSSGAWSALWLQITYPDLFNGAWALSPDPVDFHDFFGADITKPGQNFYVDATGQAYGMCRSAGHDLTTLRHFVLGTQGCDPTPPRLGASTEKPWAERQFDTYDDIFSPLRSDGSAAPLLNRQTGAIDALVAKYWEEHYDITHILQERWSTIGSLLAGKLHVFVGGQDTFHLDGPVALMRNALTALGSDAEFGIAPGANHWQIYDYHGGMIEYALDGMTQRLSLNP